MSKANPIRLLILPLIAVSLFFWLYTSKASTAFLNDIFGILFFISLTWLINNFLKIFIWDLLFDRSFKISFPQLIKDFVAILLFFAAILLIISQVFERSITGLLAASGLLGLIVGMAVQNIINDLFSGITLNFDRNFHVGDSIILHDVNKKGKIRELTWRSTRLDTEGTGLLIVPNSLISTMSITNMSRRKILHAELSLPLSSAIPTPRAMSILDAALRSTEGVLSKPRPSIKVSRFDSEGVIYKLYFWLEPTKTPLRKLKHNLFHRILLHFSIAGLGFYKLPEGSLTENVLANCRLFDELKDDEKEYISQNMSPIKLKNSESIVEEATAGDSMFIVAEGLLGIYIQPSTKQEKIRAGYLSSGDFFGETSLLTGAARTATITAKTDCLLYEIKKSVMSELIEKNPEIARRLSKALAENKIKNEKISEDLAKNPEEMGSLVQDFYNSIKRFFKL